MPTIYDIKRNHRGFFFSKETMAFFGDTLKNFGVKTINGHIYVYRKQGRRAVWEYHQEPDKFTGVFDSQIITEIYGG